MDPRDGTYQYGSVTLPSLIRPMSRSRFTSATIDRSKPLSFLLLGTGGSAAVPVISCVTDLVNACACCRDTMPGGTGLNSKNRRGNTGGILRIPQLDGGEASVLSHSLVSVAAESDSGLCSTILVDCGKTFREQALRFFPEKGLRRIDACILTHHHAVRPSTSVTILVFANVGFHPGRY